MSHITNPNVVDYLRKIINVNNTEILKELSDYAVKHNIPIITPEIADFISFHLKLLKPKKILEIGTAIGYSSILFAGVLKDARILTIEKDEAIFNIAEKNIEKANLKDRISILEGNALHLLPSLGGEWDFIFLDAAKGQYINLFPHIMKILKKGGILIADNVLYKGMVVDEGSVTKSKKTIIRNLKEFIDAITNNEILTTSIFPIGDGISISVKKGEF